MQSINRAKKELHYDVSKSEKLKIIIIIITGKNREKMIAPLEEFYFKVK